MIPSEWGSRRIYARAAGAATCGPAAVVPAVVGDLRGLIQGGPSDARPRRGEVMMVTSDEMTVMITSDEMICDAMRRGDDAITWLKKVRLQPGCLRPSLLNHEPLNHEHWRHQAVVTI